MIDLEAQIRAIVRDELAKSKPAANDGPAMVTIAAYARARSISESTVRLAIREGRLEAHKIGRAVRIRAADEIARPVKAPDESYTEKVVRRFRAAR